MEVIFIGVLLSKHSFKHFNKDDFSIRRDDVFKIIFGSNINSNYLKDFLEAILHTNITDIKVKNEVSLEKIHSRSKLIKVDILAEINKKELINIEIQNRKDYNIIKRGQAHASKIYYNSLGEGFNYHLAKKTIIIWILDYDIFPNGPYHETSQTVRTSNGEIISDDITYHYIQLEKFYNQVKEIITPEEQWLAYLSCQLNQKELEGVFAMNENIRDVDKLAEEVLKDKELWEAINDKIMEKNLENLKLEYAHDEGEQQKAIQIAKKMKASNKPIEEIIEFTELTKEEIEKL